MASLKEYGKAIPFVGGLLGDGPQANIVGLDRDTKRMINEGTQRAINATPESISAQMMAGAEPAAKGLAMPDAAQTAGSTGQDEGMLRAIQNKFRGETAKDLRKFRTQSDMQSKILKGQRMQQMSQQALMQQNVQTQNFAMLSQAYQQNEAARAQVISSIIGVGTNAAMIGTMNPGPRQTQTAVTAFNSGNDYSSLKSDFAIPNRANDYSQF